MTQMQNQKNKTILVIENSPHEADVLRRILEESYAVLQSADLKEAIPFIQDKKPSLIVASVDDPHSQKSRAKKIFDDLTPHLYQHHIPLLGALNKIKEKEDQNLLEIGYTDTYFKPYLPDLFPEKIDQLLKQWLKKKKILVLDQDQKFLNSLIDELREFNYVAEGVTHLEGALRHVETTFYDLIFIDSEIEEKSGQILCQKIKRHLPKALTFYPSSPSYRWKKWQPVNNLALAIQNCIVKNSVPSF